MGLLEFLKLPENKELFDVVNTILAENIPKSEWDSIYFIHSHEGDKKLRISIYGADWFDEDLEGDYVYYKDSLEHVIIIKNLDYYYEGVIGYTYNTNNELVLEQRDSFRDWGY